MPVGTFRHRAETPLRRVVLREETLVQVSEEHRVLVVAADRAGEQVNDIVELAVLVLVGLQKQSCDKIIRFNRGLAVKAAAPLPMGILLDQPSAVGVEKTERAPTYRIDVHHQPVTVGLRIGKDSRPLQQFLHRFRRTIRQAGFVEVIAPIEQSDDQWSLGETPRVIMLGRGRLSPGLQVRAFVPVRTGTPHHFPALFRHAVGEFFLVMRGRPQTRQVFRQWQRLSPGNVGARQLLDVFVQRVQKLVADVGVRLPKIDVHHLGGDVAGDLHQGNHVQRSTRNLQPGRADRFDVGISFLKGVEDLQLGQRIDIRLGIIRHAPRP